MLLVMNTGVVSTVAVLAASLVLTVCWFRARAAILREFRQETEEGLVRLEARWRVLAERHTAEVARLRAELEVLEAQLRVLSAAQRHDQDDESEVHSLQDWRRRCR